MDELKLHCRDALRSLARAFELLEIMRDGDRAFGSPQTREEAAGELRGMCETRQYTGAVLCIRLEMVFAAYDDSKEPSE